MGKLRDFCFERSFGKALRACKTDRDVSVLKQRIDTLAVYYRYQNEKEWKSLQHRLLGLNPFPNHVYILVFDPEHQIKDTRFSLNFTVAAFDKKDLRYSHMPRTRGKNVALNEFFKRRYSLYMDLSPDFHEVDAGVSGLVRARLKVGKAGYWGTRAHDLILQPDPSKDYVEGMVESVNQYLPLLNKH